MIYAMQADPDLGRFMPHLLVGCKPTGHLMRTILSCKLLLAAGCFKTVFAVSCVACQASKSTQLQLVLVTACSY
jgi:hypothetical protein